MKEVQVKRLNVRFTPTEVDMIRTLSEETGLSMADIVRQAVRKEHKELLKKSAQ